MVAQSNEGLLGQAEFKVFSDFLLTLQIRIVLMDGVPYILTGEFIPYEQGKNGYHTLQGKNISQIARNDTNPDRIHQQLEREVERIYWFHPSTKFVVIAK